MTRAVATLALALALAGPRVAHADDAPRPLTLAEAQARARGHNHTRLGQEVAVARAAATATAAAGVDDLIVEAGVEGLVHTSPAVDGVAFQDTATRGLAARAALWKPLRWGGRVGVQVRDDVARGTSRIAVAGPAVDVDTTVHRPRVELIWLQPLARGRGRAVHDRARRQAEHGVAVERAGVAAVDAQLGLDVATAYWELAYAAHEVTLRDRALEVARGQLEVTRARTEAGRGSELEVLAVEQAIATREVARLAAIQDQAAHARDLQVLLADDRGGAVVVADPLIDPAPAPAPLPDAARAAALAFAPELRALAAQGSIAALEVAAARAERGPAIDLIVRGGPTGSADTAGAAWAQLGRFDGYEVSAGVSVALAVGDRAARGRAAAARHQRAQLDHARAAHRGRVAAAVGRAVDALVLSDRRIAAAATAAALAERNVALELDRWRTGVGTNFDVLARQDQAVAAASALARTHADRRLAAAALAALTGAVR